MTPDSSDFFEFMSHPTSLRRTGKFKEAVAWVEEQLPSMAVLITLIAGVMKLVPPAA